MTLCSGGDVSIFGKRGMPLGSVDAPDEETARKQAIQFFSIPTEQQFRVVAVKVAEAKVKG